MPPQFVQVRGFSEGLLESIIDEINGLIDPSRGGFFANSSGLGIFSGDYANSGQTDRSVLSTQFSRF